jgi:hypothetical protein
MGFGFTVLGQEADRRKELSGRIFSIDSVLNSMAINLDIRLLITELMASGNQDLLLDKIDSSDLF